MCSALGQEIVGDGRRSGGADRFIVQAVPRRDVLAVCQEVAREYSPCRGFPQVLDALRGGGVRAPRALQSELCGSSRSPGRAAVGLDLSGAIALVKGSAATLGFSRIVDIAHAAENLNRAAQGQAGEDRARRGGLLFAATDALVKEIVKLDKKEDDERTITLVDGCQGSAGAPRSGPRATRPPALRGDAHRDPSPAAARRLVVLSKTLRRARRART